MMKKVIAGVLLSGMLAATFASTNAARADVGPDVEYFRPFSDKTKNRFGSSVTSVGFGFSSVRPKSRGKWEPDVSVLRAKDGDDRALLIMAGGQYRRTFASDISRNDRFVPYYGAGVNAIYGRIRTDDERDSDFGFGASVFIGTSIGRKAYVEARVRGLSEVADYNFSGVSLSAGLRF